MQCPYCKIGTFEPFLHTFRLIKKVNLAQGSYNIDVSIL